MRVKEFRTKFNDIYIYTIGDIHLGDLNFTEASEKKLKGYIEFIKKTPNAFAILQGDILNVATRLSKTSPFDQNMTLKEQIERAVELFEPIKGKILGAVDGNHENRLSDFTGYSPTISLCERLGIDYMKDSAIYIIRMSCHSKKDTPRTSFTIYSAHGSGGGKSIGSKMNRVDAMRAIVSNCDVYASGHNHMMGCVPTITQVINSSEGKVETIRQMLVDTGSFLDWNNSYAERLQLPPSKLGSPRIHLIVERKTINGVEEVHRDVHVSL
jgi:hypothetical protein